ncbi:hypothetical protein DRH29_02885 [candidate division Kazan bacterium]|uniref:Uncharacterized protein n=1 Tax=candidate division Kazan bacterium TaxID=2202143 RepID=A0A420ZCT4_UNCK3|nr:MAG: hypothetical protein DRH29_02885 [candidate division Kazan bacterium]
MRHEMGNDVIHPGAHKYTQQADQVKVRNSVNQSPTPAVCLTHSAILHLLGKLTLAPLQYSIHHRCKNNECVVAK